MNEQKLVHPGTFMFLCLPFGIFNGFAQVTIGFLLSNAGISISEIAMVVAIPTLPNIFKVLWAPIVDTTLTAKRWFNISNICTAAGILAITFIPFSTKGLPAIYILVLAVSFANTFLPMATESIIAYSVPDNIRGRVSGWYQSGNLGGYGLGGGAGIWLSENMPDIRIAGAIIAACCLLCSLWLVRISQPPRIRQEQKYLKTVADLGKNVLELIKSRTGFLGLILVALPIASGAASGLWSSVYRDWHASAKTVELVVGVFGGVMSAIGCLSGGWLCDRMNRRNAYILFGLMEASCALLMAIGPKSETMFVIGTLLYALAMGFIYASFSAFVLEIIGRSGAATRYNIFAAFANIPIYVMTIIDGNAHEKWGSAGLLDAEIIIPVLGALIFGLVAWAVNKRRRKPVQQEIIIS